MNQHSPLQITVRLLTFACLLLLAAHCSLLTVWAQSNTATLSGTVTDTNGAVVPGVDVKVTDPATGLKRTATTNESGQFVVPLLPASTYSILLQHAGFMTAEVNGVVLNVNDDKSLKIQLKAGDIKETVNVTGEAPLINESPAVGTVIDRQFVANIPMNGRSFQTLIELTPGVVAVPGASQSQGEFSVNGQRTEANYYTVDGVSANVGNLNIHQTGQTPMLTTVGTTQSLASVDALQEFRVNTSTYSAEFGRSPGAQIAITTRSGTNSFHGSAFEYFRNNVLDANNWFNNRAGLKRTAERQNDFGGTFSGPIYLPRFGEGGPSWFKGKNKAFFFFSYEGLRLAIPQPAFDAFVPTLCLRGKGSCAAGDGPAAGNTLPLVNAFPLPNGPDQGNGTALLHSSFSTPSNLDAYSIRVDHNFGSKLSIFGRYADTPSNSISRATSNAARVSNTKSDVRVLTVGATSLFSPRVANELRFNYTKNDGIQITAQDNFGGATPLTVADVMGGFTPPRYFLFSSILIVGGRVISPQLGYGANPADQWNVTDSLSTTIGSHQLKFGIDYRRQSALQGSIELFDSYLFFGKADLQSGRATSASVQTSSPVAHGFYRNFSAFVQDDWKATKRLTVSVGLRWDVNPAPTSDRQIRALTASDLSTTTLAPIGTPLYKTDYHGFGPRFGVAYMLRDRPGFETVIRGGFGVFYDTGSANSLLGYDLGYGGRKSFPGQVFPFTPAQQVVPPTAVTPPYGDVSIPDPNLRLPYTLEWNTAVEQSLGKTQTLTVSYVGASGRRLLQSFFVTIPATNPNFVANSTLTTEQNRSSSSYNALQAQFQRRLSKGLQAVASYTWSHAIDDLSSNGNFGSSNGTRAALRRGNADFDVRHSFSAAVTYDLPWKYSNPFASALLKNWSLNLRQSARSALPLNVLDGSSQQVLPGGQQVRLLPDIVPGVAFYLNDATAPGGRRLNPAAFAHAAGTIGNEPRNFLRGFGASQTDFSVQREFPIQERVRLQFRAEFFNIFNHPNFGSIDTSWTPTSTTFGRSQATLNNSLGGLNSLYQIGGPRSIQFALRMTF